MTHSYKTHPTLSVRKQLAQWSGVCVLIALTGCASAMSKKDCETTDYYQMGLEDGKDGKATERLVKTANECRSQGVAVPEAKYTYGRQVGLSHYCTEGRAKDDAKNSRVDSICMREKVPPYETAYTRTVTELRQEKTDDLADVQKTKDKLQKKEDKLQGELKQIDQTHPATPAS